ncbi:hypothetical protein MCERE19_03220 [Spirosomataceae bacterium]|jgi:hypothetical protein
MSSTYDYITILNFPFSPQKFPSKSLDFCLDTTIKSKTLQKETLERQKLPDFINCFFCKTLFINHFAFHT